MSQPGPAGSPFDRIAARTRLKTFLDGLGEAFDPHRFAIDEEAPVDVLERLVELEGKLDRVTTESEGRLKDGDVDRDLRQREGEARLALLRTITYMAAGIVGIQLLLLAFLIYGMTFLNLRPDEWFLRLLAGGPLTATIATMGTIVGHYWPHKAPSVLSYTGKSARHNPAGASEVS